MVGSKPPIAPILEALARSSMSTVRILESWMAYAHGNNTRLTSQLRQIHEQLSEATSAIETVIAENSDDDAKGFELKKLRLTLRSAFLEKHFKWLALAGAVALALLTDRFDVIEKIISLFIR